MNIASSDYLIIGGTTKAGTTSLFNYLASHPEICPASFKETRFFLDLEYPLKSKYRFGADELEKYGEYYLDCSKTAIRLEATPDYLYSKGCAKRISTNLPKARMIFILRDPIARLYSWYLFSQQDSKLDQKITFDDYVRTQMEYTKSSLDNAPQHMKSLEQGCYAVYIRDFIEALGNENCLILFLEDLERAPLEVMQRICHFANISDDFYSNYQFGVANKTQSMRLPKLHGLYKDVIYQLRKFTHHHSNFHKIMRMIRRCVDVFYLRINVKQNTNSPISVETREILSRFYAGDQSELAHLLETKFAEDEDAR